MNRKQSGLTLVELLISVVILGILMAVLGPIFSNALTFMESAKKSEVKLNNQKLAAGMLSFARNHNGMLPPERPDFSLYNSSATQTVEEKELFLELTGVGVPPNEINTTGYGMDLMKMYQVVGGLEHKQPLFFSTGDEVTLNYEVGVIYQSNCPLLSACKNAPFAADRTERLTAGTIASWDVKGEDYAPVMINTLAEQKTLLRITLGRLNRLSDRFSSHFYAKSRVSEQSGVNHFAGLMPLLGSKTPDGCWTQWDDLSSTNTLASIGLDRNEYGKTAWGGRIEYCRDYKPDALVGGEPPFYAALRINKNLKPNSHPAASGPANAIITF